MRRISFSRKLLTKRLLRSQRRKRDTELLLSSRPPILVGLPKENADRGSCDRRSSSEPTNRKFSLGGDDYGMFGRPELATCIVNIAADVP